MQSALFLSQTQRKLGLTTPEFARLMGYEINHVRRSKRGEIAVSKPMLAKAKALHAQGADTFEHMLQHVLEDHCKRIKLNEYEKASWRDGWRTALRMKASGAMDHGRQN